MVPVKCSHLTDDELWVAISKNTNSVSALFESGIWGPSVFWTNAKLAVARALDKLEREYQSFVTELRSRHSLVVLNPQMPSSIGSDQAA
jgi:hypothetical protein